MSFAAESYRLNRYLERSRANGDHRRLCAALGDQLRTDLTRAGISPQLLAHFGNNHSTTTSLQVAGGVVTITVTAEQTTYHHIDVDEHVRVIIDSVLADAVRAR